MQAPSSPCSLPPSPPSGTSTWAAKIVADTTSRAGARIVTAELTLPRIVLAEANTHRDGQARNSASTRAVPLTQAIARALEDPYVPDEWPATGPGMVPAGVLAGQYAARARVAWLQGRDAAVATARALAQAGVHKEIAGRVLEPYQWQVVLVTMTHWDNYFALRLAPAASRPLRLAVEALRDALASSTSRHIAVEPATSWRAQAGLADLHLPYLVEDDVQDLEVLVDGAATAAAAAVVDATPGSDPITAFRREVRTRVRVAAALVSAARCARVSFRTHGTRRSVTADLEAGLQRLRDGHMSPFEHPARPATLADAQRVANMVEGVQHFEPFLVDPGRVKVGPFRGWIQLRKDLPGEADPAGAGRTELENRLRQIEAWLGFTSRP